MERGGSYVLDLCTLTWLLLYIDVTSTPKLGGEIAPRSEKGGEVEILAIMI